MPIRRFVKSMLVHLGLTRYEIVDIVSGERIPARDGTWGTIKPFPTPAEFTSLAESLDTDEIVATEPTAMYFLELKGRPGPGGSEKCIYLLSERQREALLGELRRQARKNGAATSVPTEFPQIY